MNRLFTLPALQKWFYTATAYNLVWGTWVILFPKMYFDWLGMEQPNYLSIWQSVGMIVQVYALGYWLIAREPHRYAALVWVGLIGKTFGPIGFVQAVIEGKLPLRFGWTILTNDLIWWPSFWVFAIGYAFRPLIESFPELIKTRLMKLKPVRWLLSFSKV